MEDQPIQITFGEKFQQLRLTTGRTLEETAVLLKKRLITYIRLENDFLYPSNVLLHRVSQLYGITYQELLEYGNY